jgi:GntR family transcriptional regulator/MocR family aminotransferase
MLSNLRATGARVIGVPVDEDGFDVRALERLLARHEVKLVGLQTACQNPTGRDLSADRRERLAELAVERNFFVLEDRVYADLRYVGDGPRSLRELAPAHVIYVNSLSKVVGGGLRVGWIAARGPVSERLAMLKLETDFHTPTLVQHIAARYLASGAYDRHVRRMRQRYRRRRDALLETVAGRAPGLRPRGIAAGLHLVLDLPAGTTEHEVGNSAAERSLAVGALGPFRHAPAPDDPQGLVVGYAAPPEHGYTQALAVLGDVLAAV